MKAAITIWKRYMRKFFRGRMELAAALFFPLTLMAFFGVMMRRFLAGSDLLGGADYLVYITPGIIALTALTSAMLAGTNVLNDRIRGVIQEYLVAPIPRASIAGAVMLSGVTRGFVQAVIIVVVGALLGAVPLMNPGGLLIAVLGFTLFCAGFTGLAVAGAARAPSMEAYHGLIMLLNIPLLFLSNALYPLEAVPVWLRLAAWANPTTYAINSMRQVFPPAAGWPPLLDLVILGLFAGLG
ncbi:MAG: ABC transporter permease, partial [Thermaerobacterales bacterium]